ncbi:general substrate transporter [Coniochaeta sp. 2T2.1]|nr:general substrate transporter [Coniochaeta sp. 2T2.1]
MPGSVASFNEDNYGLREHWKVLAMMTLVSLSTFQYGLDFGIIGGLQAMVGFLKVFGEPAPETPLGYNLSAERQQLISSLMTLGAFISSSTAGFTALVFGRKMSLWIACVMVFGSTALMQATTSIAGLYAGRLIIGFGNGLLMTHSQLYIHETSPAKYRGLAISAFLYWTSVGTLVGTVIDNFTQRIETKNSYIISLGIVHVVPVILTVGLFFIPESPRWLLDRGHEAKAERALERIRPRGWDTRTEFDQMKAALEAERLIATSVGMVDIFKNPIDRRRTFLSIASVTSQAASGSMFMIAYGTYFLAMAGIGDPFGNTCILIGCGVAAIIINSIVTTRYGYRRVMLMSGLLLCGVCQLIIAAVYTVEPGTKKTGQLIVAFAIIYIMGYNGMISSYAWLGGGEFPSQRLRSYTFGIATAIGFFAAWLTTFTAPYFINPAELNWGPKYGYIWAPICVLTAAWVFFFFPETKDRTLEQIDEMFEARLPARKFRGYNCTRTAANAHAVADEKVSEDEKAQHVTVDEHVEDSRV